MIALAIIFIILKILNIITWFWWLVLLPLFIYIAIWLLEVIVVAILAWLGYNAMLNKLTPERIIFYGKVPKQCRGNIIQIQSFGSKLNEAVLNGW
ncbi:hypothetical protein J2Z60_002171 [Lactobacillus colini]|uniref:Uncharacterized protein n=1 Tax=Lactobacillus colini TaxID=1819254 RepID=A0ABS4MGZ5_9LACO|nr:hypothetical protein [Lactobacillus colini]MBP2058970.1 hypothetical protein [Lactobacillus colini]